MEKYSDYFDTDSELSPGPHESGFSFVVMFLGGIAVFAAAVSLQLLTEYGVLSGMLCRIVVEVLFAVSYILLGFRMLCDVYDQIVKGSLFGPELAVSFGTMVLYFIGEYVESNLAVMFFVPIRAFFRRRYSGFMLYAENTADLRASEAERAEGDGTWQIISSDDIKKGDVLRVRPGVRFPADGTVERGEDAVSSHYLTGDMCPYSISPGVEIKAGMVAGEGEVIIRAADGSSSSVSHRVYHMFESLRGELRAKSVGVKKALMAVNFVVIVSAVILAVLKHTVADEPAFMWIKRAAVLVAISSMCALYDILRAADLSGVLAVIKRGIKPGSLDAVRRLQEVGSKAEESSDLIILNDSPRKLQEAASLLKTASQAKKRVMAVVLIEKAVLLSCAGFGIIGMFPAVVLDAAISLLCLMDAESVI